MRLKTILGLFSFSILSLPVVMVFLIRIIFGMGSDQDDPIYRGIRLTKEVRLAVSYDQDGSMRPREGYRAPEWLSLVLLDPAGKAIYSSVSGISKGQVPGPRGLAAIGGQDSRNRIYLYEHIVQRGQIVGSFAASYDLSSGSPNSNLAQKLTTIFLLLGITSVCIVGSGILATTIVSRLGKLERGAAAIASGDFESSIDIRGPTELKSLATSMETMRRNLKEDQSQRARFLAAVSHDLRTPLTSIKGYVEALQDGLDRDSATRSRYLAIMAERSALLERRISELLEYTGLQTEAWRMRFEAMDIHGFLLEFCRAQAENAQAQDRRFDFRLDLPKPLVLRADRELLSRALENVVANAIHFCPPGKLVSLSAFRDPASNLAQASYCLAVDDQGPGIPEAERHLVFEAYYRGSRDRGGGGSGLGLFIAKSILEGHGWTLSAQTAPASPDRPGGGARLLVCGLGLSQSPDGAPSP